MPMMSKPIARSHFDWFGLPESFALDAAALADGYRRAQSAVHPDRHAQGGETARRVAMQMAAQVNEAYRVLSDPARRAAYLCRQGGVDPGFESNTAMPADFLMQQMTWREMLEDARRSRDADALTKLRREVIAARASTISGIAQALDQTRDLPRAAEHTRTLMFLDRLIAEVDGAVDVIDGL